SGRQVMETVGSARDGWTRRKAEAALRHRLADVEREEYVRPRSVAFETVALAWLDEYPAAQALKASTIEGYRCIVRSHLVRAFGGENVGAIDTARVERYIASKRRAGLSARTVNRHVNVLGLIFRSAKR